MTGPFTSPTPPVQLDALQRGLEIEASKEVARTEHQLFLISLKGMRESAPQIDKFVGWCLTGTGATFGLLVTNLDKIVGLIGSTCLRSVMLLLAISFLCGTASKFRGMLLQMNVSVDSHLERMDAKKVEHLSRTKELENIATTYKLPLNTGIEPIRVVRTLFSVFPWFARWQLNRLLGKMTGDHLYQYRVLAGNILAQSLWAGAEVAAIVLAMVNVAFSV